MSQSSPRVGLPYLQPSQAQKHVTHNDALQRLDAVVQLGVQGFEETTPPSTPTPGEIHGLGSAPTGAWAGHADTLAYWDGTGWIFIPPGEGWIAWGHTSQDVRVWRNGQWQPLIAQAQNLEFLGIGAAADATNRLSVASQASLFSHDGNDHRLSINKAQSDDTASVLFQSGWSGHAEIGLSGENAFGLKLSADGQSWYHALHADPAAGTLQFAPATVARMTLNDTALQLDVPLTGAAVQTDPSDSTTGRLLAAGAFGLGSTTLPAIPADDFDQQVITGFSRNLSTPSNAPRTWFGQMVMTMRGYDDSFFQMSAIRQEDQLWFRRASTDGIPGDWREIMHSGNIVGDLDDPEDHRIIEQGSNANGYYVRFADGTQICWQALTLGSILDFGSGTYASPYRTGQQDWTFPASFVDGTYIPFGQARLSTPTTSGTRNAISLTGQFGRFNSFLSNISITRNSSDATDDQVIALLCAIGQYK